MLQIFRNIPRNYLYQVLLIDLLIALSISTGVGFLFIKLLLWNIEPKGSEWFSGNLPNDVPNCVWGKKFAAW